MKFWRHEKQTCSNTDLEEELKKEESEIKRTEEVVNATKKLEELKKKREAILKRLKDEEENRRHEIESKIREYENRVNELEKLDEEILHTSNKLVGLVNQYLEKQKIVLENHEKLKRKGIETREPRLLTWWIFACDEGFPRSWIKAPANAALQNISGLLQHLIKSNNRENPS